MRLIDADALLNREVYYDRAECLVLRYEIEKAPTIEAEPVVHGRWVWNENAMDWGLGGWVCSECQEKNDNIPAKPDIHPSGWVGSHCCPNCGAKMRASDDG